MWIIVSKCRNFDASQKWRTQQEIFNNNEKYILFGNDAPDCMNCSIHYESNGGVPCRVAYNPEIYKGGKYKNRPELAARRVCKRSIETEGERNICMTMRDGRR